MNSLIIRDARGPEDLCAVYRITYKAYLASGLCEPDQEEMIMHHPTYDVNPHSSVLLVEEEGQVVGTVTLTSDSPYGIPADREFKHEIDELRKKGFSLSSAWRLNILPDNQHNREIVKLLMQEIVRRMEKNKLELCLLTACSRHAPFYRRLGNAQIIARGTDSNPCVKEEHKEVVLLSAMRKEMSKKWF